MIFSSMLTAGGTADGEFLRKIHGDVECPIMGLRAPLICLVRPWANQPSFWFSLLPHYSWSLVISMQSQSIMRGSELFMPMRHFFPGQWCNTMAHMTSHGKHGVEHANKNLACMTCLGCTRFGPRPNSACIASRHRPENRPHFQRIRTCLQLIIIAVMYSPQWATILHSAGALCICAKWISQRTVRVCLRAVLSGLSKTFFFPWRGRILCMCARVYKCMHTCFLMHAYTSKNAHTVDADGTHRQHTYIHKLLHAAHTYSQHIYTHNTYIYIRTQVDAGGTYCCVKWDETGLEDRRLLCCSDGSAGYLVVAEETKEEAHTSPDMVQVRMFVRVLLYMYVCMYLA